MGIFLSGKFSHPPTEITRNDDDILVLSTPDVRLMVTSSVIVGVLFLVLIIYNLANPTFPNHDGANWFLTFCVLSITLLIGLILIKFNNNKKVIFDLKRKEMSIYYILAMVGQAPDLKVTAEEMDIMRPIYNTSSFNDNDKSWKLILNLKNGLSLTLFETFDEESAVLIFEILRKNLNIRTEIFDDVFHHESKDEMMVFKKSVVDAKNLKMPSDRFTTLNHKSGIKIKFKQHPQVAIPALLFLAFAIFAPFVTHNLIGYLETFLFGSAASGDYSFIVGLIARFVLLILAAMILVIAFYGIFSYKCLILEKDTIKAVNAALNITLAKKDMYDVKKIKIKAIPTADNKFGFKIYSADEAKVIDFADDLAEPEVTWIKSLVEGYYLN